MSSEKLEKTLTLADVFCISAGAMISSGIFILPGLAFAQIGPAVFLAYALAGVCALVGALATVELATAMPLAGGIYFYTGRSLGPLAGTVSGLLNWSAIALKSSFAIFGMSEVICAFLPLSPVLCGVMLTLVFLAVNLIGTKGAAWTQIIMVLLLFAAMGAYIALGMPRIEFSRFSPFFAADKGGRALFAEAAFVFVAFGGLLDVASVSEEVKNPRRNLPLGMIGAIVVVTLIYVLTLVVTVGVMPAERLSGSLTPLADAARMYYGKPGFAVITFGAMMAFVTTANAGIMAAARFPYAMGRDRLVPEFFSRTCGSRKMPLPALLLTGGVMLAAQMLPLEKLVSVASTVIMLSFILTNMAVIILRESEVVGYRPGFRMPLYPLTPLLSMGIFAMLIMEMGVSSVRVALGITIAGLVLYFIFGRKVRLEYAFKHLFNRLIHRRSHGDALERELRDIVRERDGITADAFDELVERSRVEVIEDDIDFAALAHRVCRDASDAEMMSEREFESGSVLSPHVAVPFVQISGSGRFEMTLVKSRNGIRFPDSEAEIRAVFVIFCSPDTRNRCLRTLAAIALSTQNAAFERLWEKAETPEQLRNILLLAKRRRY